MHSTGCEAGQGVHQGGQDEAQQHGGGAGHHGVCLFQGASSIALSEHDYVMADIKKEVTDWEEDGSQEARDEEDEDTEEEGEEEDIGDGYDEEEEEEGKERWFNLSQLAEVSIAEGTSSRIDESSLQAACTLAELARGAGGRNHRVQDEASPSA